jgi:hypothetical protein
MSRLDEARREAELRLEQARREAAARLTEVRGAIETEVGFAPRKRYLLLLLAAGAGGLALALKGGKSRRKLAKKK